MDSMVCLTRVSIFDASLLFYAEMNMFHTLSRRILQDIFHTEINPSTRSSRAWESRTNSTQGHCSWHSLRRPRSSSALATRPGLFSGPERPLCSTSFLLLHKIDRKPCFALFLSKKQCSFFFFHQISREYAHAVNNVPTGCPRTMTGVSQLWFSGHFRQVFSTPMHYPALTLAPTCGAIIMTGVY